MLRIGVFDGDSEHWRFTAAGWEAYAGCRAVTNEPPDTVPEDAAGAAERLRHDLGKAIRLSAPDSRERSTEALRARLHADVLETRRDASGPSPAADVFERWWMASADHFPRGSDLRRRVDRVAHAMEEIRDLAARLPRLERPDLERLDRLTEDVARACRALGAAARNSGTKP
jgi:hypothetical protein